MSPCLIAPSILSANFAKLGQEVDAVLAAGADWVHFDVMDNHYVPNLTIGPLVCEALRKHGVTAPIDVHLMVKPVDRIVPDFAQAGATSISFHPEASEHIDRTIQLIHANGCKAGIVLNPATPLNCRPLTGSSTTPSTGSPSCTRAIFTVNSPLRATNSRVPSNGSTSQKVRATAGISPRDAASSATTGQAGRNNCNAGVISASARSSASVTGESSALSWTSKSLA